MPDSVTDVARERALSDFLAALPRLHSWDGGKTWVAGGFSGDTLRNLADAIDQCIGPGACILETGAGASTIAFLLGGATSVTSVSPDAALFGRIRAYCNEHGIDHTRLRSIVDRSEVALPAIAAAAEQGGKLFDVALIDGGHGWPTVFVDFCYAHAALRKDGLLILDDVQIHSVKELARFLAQDPRFELARTIGNGKTLVWLKRTPLRYLPDFGAQPYIKDRTEQDKMAGREFSLF